MSGPLNDEEQELLRAGMGGKPEFMMPFATPEALHLFVIHALRDMSSQQRDTATALREVKDQMIRWEQHVDSIGELKDDVKALKEEQQQRAGMVLFIQWVGKYFPWMLSAAAAVWAVKTGGR